MAYDPKTGKGLGDLYDGSMRCTKRREWRGFKDTFYDFFRWLKLLGMLGATLAPVLPQMMKALKRYRWMASYLSLIHISPAARWAG